MVQQTYAEAEKDNVKWARQAAKEKEALEAAARKSAPRSGVAIDGTGESTADGPDEHSETAPEGAVSPQRGHLRQVGQQPCPNLRAEYNVDTLVGTFLYLLLTVYGALPHCR